MAGDGAETVDAFGASLAAANLGKSSAADLAVGVLGEGVGAVGGAGAVNVLYGSASGLTAAGDQLWHQNTSGIGDGAEPDDGFGFSLAAANFGKSAAADLAVGVQTEDVGATFSAGAVSVLYGSPSGLSAAGDQFWPRTRAASPMPPSRSTSSAPRSPPPTSAKAPPPTSRSASSGRT
jgi:hypothetical protein